MKILRPGSSGLSRIELICIILIGAVALAFAIKGLMFLQQSMSEGDDAMKAKTCERVASMNLLETGCVVTDCGRQKDEACSHQRADGATAGYYDAVERKVFADKPEGYNEHEKLKIGSTVYRGDVNTMVIKTVGKGTKVKLSWVKGEQ